MRASSLGVISDIDLVTTLPGFKNVYAEVNGIRLHYVEGGTGAPLILLPSWPQTWWEFRRVLPPLAERYRVLAVDFRGMGSSDKADNGYDKKTMASDIQGLESQLGLGVVNIAGNDVGAMVAAYGSADALLAANSWFSSFATDIDDTGCYAPLTIPVLGLGGISYDFLTAFLDTAAPDATVLKLPNTGHWIPDEQPEETVRHFNKFFG